MKTAKQIIRSVLEALEFNEDDIQARLTLLESSQFQKNSLKKEIIHLCIKQGIKPEDYMQENILYLN